MEFICTWTIWKRSESDKASRYFFTIPVDSSKQIQSIMSNFPRKGRWSVRVKARIWRLDRETSIFPDKKSWCYLLPIKADVRKKLELKEDIQITLILTIL